MQMGSQLYAPDGYGVLCKGIVYHLLRNDPQQERVIFVEFCRKAPTKKKTRDKRRGKAEESHDSASVGRRHESLGSSIEDYSTVLSFLNSFKFETGLDGGEILLCEEQRELPPWFGKLTIDDLRACDLRHPDRKVTHEARTTRLMTHLEPLVQNLDQVLSAQMPDKLINAHARACCPVQHEGRFRTAFYAYLCFGCTTWALHYSFQNIGRWDRKNHPGKLGRPSVRQGAQHGHGCTSQEMQDRILEGYRKFNRPGEHLTTIYHRTLVVIFGCVTQRNASGSMTFIHPAGLPFPSVDQFTYRISQAFPLKERQIYKFGQARVRNHLTHSLGRFTESVSSLMERVELDGYQCEEVCKGYLPDSHLPPLLTVRMRCLASGIIAGVGFSVGAEKASAYRMALFSAAIDKVKFAKLFGLELSPQDWPSRGIPPHVINDRGPGSTSKADGRDEAFRFIIKEGTPSYSGQSKATVETLHPKAVKKEGSPRYKETRKSIPQLAQQEILRAVRDNNATDVGDRLNNRAVIDGVLPNPVAIWNYLDSLGRSHAVNMRFEEAVRAYLTPMEVTVHDDAVYFRGNRFASKALTDSGVLQTAHDTGRFKLLGYVMDVCVRHLWVELGHQLIEVDAQLSLRDDIGQLYISVAEQDQIQQILRDRKREHQEHRLASHAEIEMRLEEVTGERFDQSTSKRGRTKRGKKASIADRQEAVPHMQFTGGRKQ